jgi:hypothetical protein
MKFYFHEDAELEFDKAIEYYEGCQTGLGLEYTNQPINLTNSVNLIYPINQSTISPLINSVNLFSQPINP